MDELSALQKWEGPDPAFWVAQGYAIVHPDSRGTWMSEGNIYTWGTREGQDGADVVDAIGANPWCNGKVGLSGNSWLSISQWFTASQRPKHLAAIAPWEGFQDLYRDLFMVGGVPTLGAFNFGNGLLSRLAGQGAVENTPAMLLQHPFGEYHEDKRAKIENIKVPAYVVASYSNPLHAYGTWNAWYRLESPKWLRVHDTNEWPDYYDPANVADLKSFFDCYLRGISNSWPQTPILRAKIVDTSKPVVGSNPSLTSRTFPPTQTTPLRVYLDAEQENQHLLMKPRAKQSSIPYTRGTTMTLTHRFEEETTLFGPIHLNLRLSVKGQLWSNAAIFVQIAKKDANGTICSQMSIPLKWYQTATLRTVHWTGLVPQTKLMHYSGPWGRGSLLRTNRNPKLSTSDFDVLDFSRPKAASQRKTEEMHAAADEEERIITVRPAIVPIGMVFHKGESLVLELSTTDKTMYIDPAGRVKLSKEQFDTKVRRYEEEIEGRKLAEQGQVPQVKILCGGREGSFLEVASI